uniref:Cortactin-binding protein 2 n=1 Tax=Phallusia mammillata TaxID=59560 RepID=A0A6F9D9H6_9ASCI|nr:cortactin-binding protein 2 [Phallusia mammillata]
MCLSLFWSRCNMEAEVTSCTTKSHVTETPLSQECRQNNKKATSKSLNMAMLGKNDLLRLLSILEGEVEARDIYITTLQAQVNRDSYVKNNYFQHNISDPFLALMRDNEAVSGSVTPCQADPKQPEQIKIAPLPLLEKVVNKYKKQQEKVKQHLALSDAYYNMINDELIQEKKKRVNQSEKKENSTKEHEQEHEKLMVLLKIEKNKTKQIEHEYKKLLQLVAKERTKYRLIITMLLNERHGAIKCDNSEPKTDTRLNEKLHELVAKNEELEKCLQSSKENEIRMTKQVELLFQQAKTLKINLEADEANLKHVQDEQMQTCMSSYNGEKGLYETPLTPPNEYSGENNLPVIDSSDGHYKTVSVKRTPSVIEKRIVHRKLGSRPIQQCPLPEQQTSDPNTVTRNFKRLPTNHVIISSPTSGAANFALNSPNQPQPSTPFPMEGLTSTEQHQLPSQSSQFQETRQKFQQIVKSSIPPNVSTTINKSQKPESLPPKRSSGGFCAKEGSENNTLPVVSRSKSVTKKKDSLHTSQSPKPPRASENFGMHSSEQTTKIRPPPLPPKKPNLLTTKQTSSKLPSAKASSDKDTGKKAGIGEKASRLSAPKVSAGGISKNHGSANSSKLGSVKRPTSLNANNSNNRGHSKRLSTGNEMNISQSQGIQPTPPGSFNRLSAQQRLFPSQDGPDGQLRSPVTNTVPKSPIGPNMFTYK